MELTRFSVCSHRPLCPLSSKAWHSSPAGASQLPFPPHRPISSVREPSTPFRHRRQAQSFHHRLRALLDLSLAFLNHPCRTTFRLALLS
jgi:hypothetical protein